MQESIQNNVGELRARNGMTQEEFAEKVGVTRQTIIAIEKGNYTPSLMLAFRIAKQFKKSIEDIFFYER